MVVAPTEPDAPADGGAGDGGRDETKRISCDDDVRAHKCNELKCNSDEDSSRAFCTAIRKRFRPSAFNRYFDCMQERDTCDNSDSEACVDITEGRCIDPPTRESCETALRTCNSVRNPRKRAPPKVTSAVCQAMASAVQARYRTMFFACMQENCDTDSLRQNCLLNR